MLTEALPPSRARVPGRHDTRAVLLDWSAVANGGLVSAACSDCQWQACFSLCWQHPVQGLSQPQGANVNCRLVSASSDGSNLPMATHVAVLSSKMACRTVVRGLRKRHNGTFGHRSQHPWHEQNPATMVTTSLLPRSKLLKGLPSSAKHP